MAAPSGFTEAPTASRLTSTNLFFSADQAVAAGNPGLTGPAGHDAYGRPRAGALAPAALMFANPSTTAPSGEPIVNVAGASKGHVSEILNFHGSPAPWILIGLLVIAGIIHLQVSGGARASGSV